MRYRSVYIFLTKDSDRNLIVLCLYRNSNLIGIALPLAVAYLKRETILSSKKLRGAVRCATYLCTI